VSSYKGRKRLKFAILVSCFLTFFVLLFQGDVYLLSVEICLDRNLNPIDCSTHDTRHLDLESVLPCPPNHQILYQDSIPTKNEEL